VQLQHRVRQSENGRKMTKRKGEIKRKITGHTTRQQTGEIHPTTRPTPRRKQRASAKDEKKSQSPVRTKKRKGHKKGRKLVRGKEKALCERGATANRKEEEKKKKGEKKRREKKKKRIT